MEPADHVTQKMEALAIEADTQGATVSTTTTAMESTDRIIQQMEDMALNPKAPVIDPSVSTAIVPSCAPGIFSQPPHSSRSSHTIPGIPDTGSGYTYTTTSTSLGPHRSPSRSDTELHKRPYQARQQQHIQAPFPAKVVHEARIEQVGDTKEILITDEEERDATKKDSETMIFLGQCLRQTKARVAAEEAAEAARSGWREIQQERKDAGMFELRPTGSRKGSWEEAFMPMEKSKRVYRKEEGDIVEESWVEW